MKRKTAVGGAVQLLVLAAGLARGGEPPDIESLFTRFKSDSPAERIEAAKALNKMSPDAKPLAPRLIPLLSDEYWDVRQCAAELLFRAGEAAVPELVKALKAPGYYPRYYAARTLARLGPQAKAALPELGSVLADAREALDVRIEAARAILSIGDTAAVAASLVVAMGGTDTTLRELGAEGVAKAGKVVVPEVVKLLKSTDRGLRLTACRALAGMGAQGREAAGALMVVFKDELEALEKEAGKIDSVGIRDSFIRHSTDTPVLAAMGCMGADVAPELVELLKTGRNATVMWVSRVLGRMGPEAKTAVGALAQVLESSPDAGNRARAAEALGGIARVSPEAMAALGKALTDKEDVVQRYSAIALKTAGGVTILAAALKNTPPAVRKLAAKTLGEMGAAAAAAVPALEEAAKDADQEVKTEAENALKVIQPPKKQEPPPKAAKSEPECKIPETGK